MKLSQLVRSHLNARNEYIAETVADLAEEIKEHTLLRPLFLRANASGQYEVIAGGRRKEALLLLHGPDYELQPGEYKLLQGDDFEALTCGLLDQMHHMGFSSLELGRSAALLKEAKHKISHKEIAKTLWTSEARVKRVLELLKDEDVIPECAAQELAMSDTEEPAFTDAHWDRIKDTALDLTDKVMVKDVCDYIISHDVPPSKVKEVVSGMLKKQEKESAASSGEDGEKPKLEKPKDPNLIGEDVFKGTLEKTKDGSWIIKSSKGELPFDPHYYTNYADHPDFKVTVNAKITIKCIRPEQ